jgi:hypothetical protein
MPFAEDTLASFMTSTALEDAGAGLWVQQVGERYLGAPASMVRHPSWLHQRAIST